MKKKDLNVYVTGAASGPDQWNPGLVVPLANDLPYLVEKEILTKQEARRLLGFKN